MNKTFYLLDEIVFSKDYGSIDKGLTGTIVLCEESNIVISVHGRILLINMQNSEAHYFIEKLPKLLL